MRTQDSLSSLLFALVLCCGAPAAAVAQVHYHEDGNPWKQRARSGPDAEVDGWYYNLGISGLRVELMAEEPTHLLVRHVLKGSPAERKV